MRTRQTVLVVLALILAIAIGLWLPGGTDAQAPPLPPDGTVYGVSPVSPISPPPLPPDDAATAPAITPEPTPFCWRVPSGWELCW